MRVMQQQQQHVASAVVTCVLASGMLAFVAEAQCSDSSSLLQVFGSDYIESNFVNPWTSFDSTQHENPFDINTVTLGVDDCAAVGVGSGADSKLYLFGGKDRFGETSRSRLYNPSACVCRSDAVGGCDADCPLSDQINGVWEPDTFENYTGLTPDAREDHIVLYDNSTNLAYIAGGVAGPSFDLWQYDVALREYTQLASGLFEGRKDLCGALYAGKLYVIGGLTLDSSSYVMDVQEYDPVLDTWTELWSLATDCADPALCPAAREDAACAESVTGEGILLLGGALESTVVVEEMWLFKPADVSWTNMELSPCPPAHEDAQAHVEAETGRLFLHGGTGPTDLTDRGVWVLNMSGVPDTWAWTETPALVPAPLVKDHCGGVSDGKLYSFSGELQDFAVRAAIMFVFDFGASGALSCPNECIGEGECSDGLTCTCPSHLEGIDCNTRVVTAEFRLMPRSLAWVMSAIAAMLGVACLAAAVAFMVMRARPAIRASSPSLLSLSMLGCALACFGIPLVGLAFPQEAAMPDDDQLPIDPTKDYVGVDDEWQPIGDFVCIVSIYWFPLAFALTWAGLFCKAQLQADLVKNSGTNFVKQANPKENRLFGIVGAFVALQLTLCTVWVINDGVTYRWEQVDSDDAFTQTFVARCHSKNKETWVLLLELFNGVALLYGAYVSLKTRHVKLLLDGKAVSKTIVFIAAVLIPTSVIVTTLGDYPVLSFVLFTVGVLAAVTGVLWLAAVPRLKERNLSLEQVVEIVTGISTRKESVYKSTFTASGTINGDDDDAESTASSTV